MPQPYIFRTVDLDGQTLRTAVRPGKPHLTPLLIFNGIGATWSWSSRSSRPWTRTWK